MINIYNEYIPNYIKKLTIYAREKAPMPVKKLQVLWVYLWDQ